jgi:hypothetical protein
MVYRKEKDSERLFAISCADWEASIKARDADEACTKAIERMLLEFGKKVKISPVMLVLDFSKFSEDMNSDESTQMVSAATVLANAGHHKWATSLNTIFRDKSNPSKDSEL